MPRPAKGQVIEPKDGRAWAIAFERRKRRYVSLGTAEDGWTRQCWADPSFPMKVYAEAVRRRKRLSGAYLEAFDRALVWAAKGGEVASGSQPSIESEATIDRESL